MNVNTTISGMFQKGWIEVKGLPFHLWSKKHLFHLAKGRGKILEIDRRTAKLVDLMKIWIKVEVEERVGIPANVRVSNGE